MCVAHYTRIRCAARQVFINKIVNYKITKLFTYVKNKMWKAMLYRSLPRTGA